MDICQTPEFVHPRVPSIEPIKADAVNQHGGLPDTSAEALQRQDRLAKLGTLSASMAHEIKNALVAGKTFIDLLLEKQGDDQLAGMVRRELDRIDSIVSQVLRYSRGARREFRELSLHEALEQSLRLILPRLEGQSLRVEKNLQAAPDLILGSDYQLEQAFVNLFLNAVDAMTPNGVLTITTESLLGADRNEPVVRLVIKDTGGGIPAENVPRLFQPFFTTKKSGTGLGLAITQGIIHEHHAVISVKSKPREGTEFTIDFPAR
jgi:signal transduction histidine kinase